MNEITLQLRFAPRSRRPESARLLPGNNARAWLDELLSWNIPLDQVRLCPLPTSRGDNTCSGALAIYGSDHAPAETGRAQRYGLIAQRVYVPVESGLSLEPSVSDWQSLLSDETAVYVWRPQLGIIAFSSDEVLGVEDLLSGPELIAGTKTDPSRSPETIDWGCAREGVVYPNRIVALRAVMPLSIESMLDDLRDGIGTRQKPPTKPLLGAETLKSIGKAIAAGVLAPFALLAKALSKLTPKAESTAPPERPLRPSVISRWFSWIKEKYSAGGTAPAGSGTTGGFLQSAMQGLKKAMQWSADLLDARQREINRLLNMLQDDPDEGLKYALPMGAEPGRGIARLPSSSLTKRSLDFSLSGRGGGAADIWSLNPRTQMQLLTRYRELAARESQLGRYRRAAYIFAELLGDLNSAAQALVTGRFFREAAIIYRDKLKRPLEAANCLEQGGLLQDAIPLFRQVGQHEKVGDLYLRLEEQDLAAEAFEDACQNALQSHDFLDAARILEQKCRSAERALWALGEGWPDSNQARTCLQAAFELRARLGHHDESIRRAKLLRSEVLSLKPQRCVDAVEVLTEMATQSPHAASRTSAADSVRIIVSQALEDKTASREQLTHAISRLALEDRLLSRDCQRANKTTSLTTRAKRRGIQLVRTFRRHGPAKWLTACETDQGFYLAGWQDSGEAVVARAAWNDAGATIMSAVTSSPHQSMPETLLICNDSSDLSVIVACPRGRVFAPHRFCATDTFPERETVVSPTWLPKLMSAMAISSTGTIYIFQLFEMLLTSYSVQRHPIVNAMVEAPIVGKTFDPDETFPIFASHDACYLGIHESLFWILAGQSTGQVQNFRLPIRYLVGSAPLTAPRLAVLFDRGGYLYWTERPGLNNSYWFGDDLEFPRAVFLRDGRLVVLAESERKRVWRVYSAVDDNVKTLFEVPCDINTNIIALLRGGGPNQVALCTDEGKVHLYEFT